MRRCRIAQPPCAPPSASTSSPHAMAGSHGRNTSRNGATTHRPAKCYYRDRMAFMPNILYTDHIIRLPSFTLRTGIMKATSRRKRQTPLPPKRQSAKLRKAADIVRDALSLAIKATKARGTFPISTLMKVPGFTARKVPMMVRQGWIKPAARGIRKSLHYSATRLAIFELHSLERPKLTKFSSSQFERMIGFDI